MTTNIPVTVAVIGVGSMGSNHARVYRDLPEADLVAVADAAPQAAQAAAHRFGVRPYTDFRQMLAEEHPQVVSIAVPTEAHEDVALAAIEAGAHVLVEKPIAATVKGAQRIIAAARQRQRQLMVGHIVRFNPAIQALKQKLDAGEMGRIFQIICRRVGPFPNRIQDVGVAIDLAPHDLDVMRYLTGLEPLRIFAEIENRLHTAHEDLLLATLRFPEGIIGLLEINWLTPTKIREVLVLGERGMFRVDDLTQELYFFENSQADKLTWPALQTITGVGEGAMTRYPISRYEPLKAELQAFLQAISSNTPVPVSGEDGLKSLRLALELIEAGRTNTVRNLT